MYKSFFDNLLDRLKRLSFYSSLSALTLLMGLFREIIIASYYGLSSELDVYVALSTIYLLFGMQLGNALEMATISKFSNYSTDKSSLVNNHLGVLSVLFSFNILIGCLLIIFNDLIVGSIFSGFSSSQLELSNGMIVFVVFSFVFANISGFSRGNLNILRRFAPNFISGAIMSIVAILSVWLLHERYGIYALLIGMLLGNLTVFLMYMYMLVESNVIKLKSFQRISYDEVLPFVNATLFIVISEVLYQVYALFIRNSGLGLGEGVVSSFYYANTLLLVPVSLFMFPLSTILFPKLTKLLSAKEQEGRNLLALVILVFIVVSMLFSLVFYTSSEWLIKIVFVRGNFTVEDAVLTASIFSIMVFIMPALSVSRIIKMGHYAIGSYKVPIYSNLILAIAVVVLSYVLIPLHGVIGLAVSAVLAMYVSVIFAGHSLRVKLKKWYD